MNNKIKTILTSLIVVTGISLMSNVYADHDTPQYWVDEDVEYKCLSGINNIPKTSNVSPCSDLSTASNYWDNVSGSNWDLDPNSRSSQVNITGASLDNNAWAAVAYVETNGNNTIESGYIQFNTTHEFTFGDITSGDDSSHTDFEYVAVHEIGHLVHFTHSKISGSVMEPIAQTGLDFTGLHSHDIAEIRGKY